MRPPAVDVARRLAARERQLTKAAFAENERVIADLEAQLAAALAALDEHAADTSLHTGKGS